MRMGGKVVELRPKVTSLDDAVGRFLNERDLSAGTRRVYALTFKQLAVDVGGDTPLGQITGDHIARHLTQRYGGAAPSTFNRNLAAVQSLLAWAARNRLSAEDPTIGIERRKARRTARQLDQNRAIARQELDSLWARTDVALREKVLWRLMYESGCRASEALGIDIEDLALSEKSARIIGKGGHAERIHWATATARLLPRLIGDRTAGPLFLTDRRSRQVVAQGDLDPASGKARLSYRRAAEIFNDATGGLTLHQLRHSQLTHLAEVGVDVALLKAKSRHRSLRSLEHYVKPSDASVAKLTADHDPARRGSRP
jgi:site-specific recombinase XerD